MLDELIRDMRLGLDYPATVEDEETAVKRYLLYISMLVDLVLPEIVMSAIATHDVMVQIKLRSLLEYSAKALYYDEHPSFALYMMTVDESASIVRKLRVAKAPKDEIVAAEAFSAKMAAKFPFPKEMGNLKFDKILGQYANSDDYVWLYGAPSALLHGDPEGLRALLVQQPDGTQVPNLVFNVAQVNAMLVDTGRNALVFCERFINRFRSEETVFATRFADLNRIFLKLILEHPYGRDEDAVAAVRSEINDLEAEHESI